MMNRHAFLDAWLKWLVQRSAVPLALELKLPDREKWLCALCLVSLTGCHRLPRGCCVAVYYLLVMSPWSSGTLVSWECIVHPCCTIEVQTTAGNTRQAAFH